METERPRVPFGWIPLAFALGCGLVSIAALLVWPGSYRYTPSVTIPGPAGSRFDLIVNSGRIMFGVFQEDSPPRSFWRPRAASLSDLIPYDDRFITADFLGWGVAIPCPVLAVVALMPLGWWLIVVRGDRENAIRRTHGLCRYCGYDLRAHRLMLNPQANTLCPECGHAIDATLENLLPEPAV